MINLKNGLFEKRDVSPPDEPQTSRLPSEDLLGHDGSPEPQSPDRRHADPSVLVLLNHEFDRLLSWISSSLCYWICFKDFSFLSSLSNKSCK